MNSTLLNLFLSFLLFTGLTYESQAQGVSFPQVYGTGSCGCDTIEVADSAGFATPGQIILQTGMKLAMNNEVYGYCWDFVNHVFNLSEVAGNKKVVYKSKKSGPYANADVVQPGDWIYHVNYQFRNIDHSAIFVCWKDVERRIAITLSYAGGNRKTPARYAEYNLSSIYAIFRPQLPLEPQKKVNAIESYEPASAKTTSGGKH